MKRLTKRAKSGNVYLTGASAVCWGGRTVGDRLFCVNCNGAKDNRGVDRSKCGPLATIDRLAAYEDTGFTPEEITAFIAPPNTPLTLEELREMYGEPVWVIVQSYETYGNWRVIRKYIEDRQAFSFYGTGMLSCCDYGKIWTAYRRKPEEGTP